MEIARYIQLPQFVSLISKGLFVPKASLFDDDLEGLASIMFNSYEEGVGPKMENDWAKEWVYASCWYKATDESMAMWNLYGKNSESLMIRSTSSKLQSILEKSEKYKYYPSRINFITYLKVHEYPKPLYKNDCKPDSTRECRHLYEDKLDDFFYKHPAYRHEQEIRLCVVEEAAVEPYEKNRNDGISLQVPKDFIDEIVFAPNAMGWFKDVVLDLTRKYKINSPCIDSDLDWHKELFSPKAFW